MLSLFVLIGSPLIVMAIMGFMGYRKRTGFLAGLTVAQTGEFSIVFVAMGISLGHVGMQALGLTTLVGLVTIAVSTYMILYSHPLYARLAPWLNVFERRDPHREPVAGAAEHAVEHPQIIVFGLGRYGTRLVAGLREAGLDVLGVDFDPEVARDYRQRGIAARFGDATDADFIETLPLTGARWVISTVPDLESNRGLIHALHAHGYQGNTAVAARDERDGETLESLGVSTVLYPTINAADYVVTTLTGIIRRPEHTAWNPLRTDVFVRCPICWRHLEREEPEMKQFRNILYVADSSLAQEQAIARAVSLAENNQAELTVVDVMPVIKASSSIPPALFASDKLQSAVVSKRHKELESLMAPYMQRHTIRIEVLVGHVFLEVIRAVIRNQHDLLIKPAENPHFVERLFGSNDMHLLRKCPCPVWLTGPEEKSNYARLLAAVDFALDGESTEVEQSLNQQILEVASSLALSDFAELHVVHVWDAPAENLVRLWADNPDHTSMSYVEGVRARHEIALNAFRDRLRDRVGADAFDHLAPQFHMRRGAAATVIPAIAKQLQTDLVVMGTVARTGIAGLFIGNTAESILDQLQCSVLAVKPRGFVSPIKLSE